jgi:hypothetical protein
MKTFQQFNEEAQVGPSSFGGQEGWSDAQMKGFSNKLV